MTASRTGRRRLRGGSHRLWYVAGIAVVLWSVLRAGLPGSGVVNTGGLNQLTRFFGAMISPRLDPEFLLLVGREAAVTVGYAILGTALSLVIGLIGGVLLTERLWMPMAGPMGWRRWFWGLGRVLFVIPRSMHEVVFGLLLVNVLGLNPLVAILAIGIPFGAVTAKVFSELLDEAPAMTERTLRAGGASKLAAMVFGTVPHAIGDLVSYSFYRFECGLRSAAVLGVVGAGGLGFQLALSFISLRYDEMWTLLWALIGLSALADWLSSVVRRHRNSAAVEMHLAPDDELVGPGLRGKRPRASGVKRVSSIVGLVAIPAAYWWLDVDIGTLWDARARREAGALVGQAWPPEIGVGGWLQIVSDSADTMAMSILAIAGAVALAFPLSFLGARGSSGQRRSLLTRVRVEVTKFILLVARSIPLPVGAFVIVFIFFPGLWPGAVALALYTAGVLGRLQAEVVENADPRTGATLRAGGANEFGVLAYATVPTVAPKFVALGLYRWEVAARETVVVGVVGAAGLGRRLSEQSAAFNYDGILATLLALIAVTIVVDLVSAAVRHRFR